MFREKTRRDRYREKLKDAKTFPISIATTNFRHDTNLAYIIRAAVCFGIEEVLVIGSHPSRQLMNKLSGSLFDYIKIRSFATPSDLIKYTKEHGIDLVSIELPPDTFESIALNDYEFDFTNKVCLVVGHETLGVPTEIMFSSKNIVFIEMPGAGSCLNVSQAANISLYESTKQYMERR